MAEAPPPLKTTLYYTFGNHMHWVDMEWLWGYATLSSSVEDMLRLIEETGVKGHINFDGIGYEKLAGQNPETVARLRAAIQSGSVEVAGASYGQPYGLFHGGESNIRQRIYGARTVRRLFGVWPRTFWEEEFDFFPQLPQILKGVGFQYASLFFQWTWHTPHLPKEKLPAIWWEGQDGSRLLASPHSDLNLHQWPEEFAGLLEDPELRQRPLPCLVQWLELMPSPDWMCRSEVILPPLRGLLEHPQFSVKPVHLPEFLELAKDLAEPRRYSLDEVFHGMSLGKNGDLFRRLSRRAEATLLAAESISALYAFFGRPYPSWDVYPTWELEEAWRELLSAQHHDNEECEGLCGYIGERSFERSLGLSGHVIERTLNLIARRTPGSPERLVVYNPLGWRRRALVQDPASKKSLLVEDLPPFGYRVVEPADHFAAPVETRVIEEGDTIILRRGELSAAVERARGAICQITSPEFPAGAIPAGESLADVWMTRGGQAERFTNTIIEIDRERPAIHIHRSGREGATIVITITLAPELDAVDIHYQADELPRPDPWLAAALQTRICVNLPAVRIIHDHPYGVSETRAVGKYLRKYPTGDWMTSPQVFETVENPFTALQFLDLEDGERGLLFIHDGSQAYLRRGDSALQVLSMYDPWDEDYFVASLEARVRVVPHAAITNAARWRQAQEFNRPVWVVSCSRGNRRRPAICDDESGNIPLTYGSLSCEASGVVLASFYREMETSGKEVEGYAGQGISYPYILRLVELNGEPAEARLTLPGRVAKAYRSDLLGRKESELRVEYSGGEGPSGLPRQAQDGFKEVFSHLSVPMGPYEIATLYLDIEAGRKIYRDLDAERRVWATVHKIEGGVSEIDEYTAKSL
jgi:alpha-mannosidase